MLISEPKPEPLDSVTTRYHMPAHLHDMLDNAGLTVQQAKALAADIRIWLIGMGHDDREEEGR